MQTCAQTFKAAGTAPRSAAPCASRRTATVVRAQAVPRALQEVAKGAALAAAAASLVLVSPGEQRFVLQRAGGTRHCDGLNCSSPA